MQPVVYPPPGQVIRKGIQGPRTSSPARRRPSATLAHVRGRTQRPFKVRGVAPSREPRKDSLSSPVRAHLPPSSPESRILIPSPEQLGIAQGAVPVAAAQFQPEESGSLDIGTVWRRLKSLGAVGLEFRQLGPHRWRFACVLPNCQADQPPRIEVQGTTEEDALRQALSQAQQLSRR